MPLFQRGHIFLPWLLGRCLREHLEIALFQFFKCFFIGNSANFGIQRYAVSVFSAPLAEKPVFFGVQIKVRVLRPSQAERAERLDFIPSCLSIGDADPRTARSIKNRDGFVFRSHPLTRPWAGSLVYFSLAL